MLGHVTFWTLVNSNKLKTRHSNQAYLLINAGNVCACNHFTSNSIVIRIMCIMSLIMALVLDSSSQHAEHRLLKTLKTDKRSAEWGYSFLRRLVSSLQIQVIVLLRELYIRSKNGRVDVNPKQRCEDYCQRKQCTFQGTMLVGAAANSRLL